MVTEIEILDELSTEAMRPGTIVVLENAGHMGNQHDPYWAILACPVCGKEELITRKQIAGLTIILCDSIECPAQFFIRKSEIVYCKPF